MSVPTVYRWDDASAPQITDYRDYTQIKAFIQAVFVDGYGAKPGLGWTMTTNDPNHEINLEAADIGTGVRPWIRLDYTNRVNSGSFFDSAIMYEKNNGGVGLNIVTTSGSTARSSCLGGGNDDQLKICPWLIIGTSRCFYTFFGYNHTVAAPTIPTQITSNGKLNHAFFGDFNESIDLGGYNFLTPYTSSTLNSTVSNETGNADGYFLAKLTQGTSHRLETSRNEYLQYVNTKNLPLQQALSSTSTTGYLGRRYKQIRYPYPDGGLYMEEVYFMNETSEMIFGKLPGFYIPLHDMPLKPVDGISTFDGTGVHAGKTFLCVSDTENFEFYFDTTSDWGV